MEGLDAVTNFIPAIDFAKVTNIVFTVFEILIIVGLMFLAYLFLVKPLIVYKTRVVILGKRGGESVVVNMDRGRFQKKNDMYIFKFLKNKKATMSQPDYKYLYTDSKGKATIFLYQYGDNDFAPIQIDSNFGDNPFVPIPSETRSMLALESLRIKKKYTRDRLLDKILAPGIFIIAMAIIMVIFISLFKNIGSMAGAFNYGAQAMARAVADFNLGRPPAG